jgi:plasmid stabilization system protein ParE
MADFFYSPQARLDLLEIWEFIAQDDVDAADRVER